MHTMRRAAEGPQCPNILRVNAAARKNSPSADGCACKLTTAPTLGGEGDHG
jgi:hypothetical protein